MQLRDFITRSEEVNQFVKEFVEELPCDMNDPQDFCMNSFLNMLRGTALTITNLINEKKVKDSQILIRTQIERFI